MSFKALNEVLREAKDDAEMADLRLEAMEAARKQNKFSGQVIAVSNFMRAIAKAETPGDLRKIMQDIKDFKPKNE